mgnify:CR=1 FL=1
MLGLGGQNLSQQDRAQATWHWGWPGGRGGGQKRVGRRSPRRGRSRAARSEYAEACRRPRVEGWADGWGQDGRMDVAGGRFVFLLNKSLKTFF